MPLTSRSLLVKVTDACGQHEGQRKARGEASDQGPVVTIERLMPRGACSRRRRGRPRVPRSWPGSPYQRAEPPHVRAHRPQASPHLRARYPRKPWATKGSVNPNAQRALAATRRSMFPAACRNWLARSQPCRPRSRRQSARGLWYASRMRASACAMNAGDNSGRTSRLASMRLTAVLSTTARTGTCDAHGGRWRPSCRSSSRHTRTTTINSTVASAVSLVQSTSSSGRHSRNTLLSGTKQAMRRQESHRESAA